MSLRSFAGSPFPFVTPHMIFPDLTAAETNPATAFIVLAWAELFGEKTPDTYKAKLHDTLSLVVEFGEVAKQAATDQRWMSHLPHVLEELQSEAKSDPVLAHHYPHLKNAIASIDKNVTRSRAARLADTVQSEMDEYHKMVSDYFLQSLGELPQRKENALDAVRRVATRAVHRGLTPGECRDCLDGSALTLEPAVAGEQLLGRLVLEPQSWFCIVAITGNSDEIATLLHGTGFSQLPNRRKPLGKVGKDFLDQTGGAWLACIEIEAAGRSEVLQATLRPLRLVLDVTNFNHRSAPFRLLPFVYMEVGGRQHLIEVGVQSDGGLEPQRDATELAVRMQREGVLARLPERIVTALEQHSVAHTSTDPKVRFVNMWVALETLVGREQESGIVDNLIRSIVPHVIHRRVNKIIKYLAICLHEYGFCRSIPDDTGWFRKSTRRRVRSDELLLALAGAAGSDVHNRLAELTAGHPLLCNRLFTTHKSVSDPKALHRELKESAERTEWQLRRIYRARNLLVHAGSQVSSLSYLATNLEYYFSLTLSRVLHDFYRYPQWSLERSFEHRQIQFEYLMRQLEQNASGITVNHVLQQGTSPLGKELLWQSGRTVVFQN
jgi:hypothetical protein